MVDGRTFWRSAEFNAQAYVRAFSPPVFSNVVSDLVLPESAGSAPGRWPASLGISEETTQPDKVYEHSSRNKNSQI